MDSINTSPTIPVRNKKYLIGGVLAIVFSVIVFIISVFAGLGGVFTAFFALADGGNSAFLFRGIPALLIALFFLLIAIAFLINGIALLQLKGDQKFRLSTFQKIFWPIALSIVFWVFVLLLSYQPSVKNVNNNAEGAKTAVEIVSQDYPSLYASLPPEQQEDLVMAYKVLHMLYEGPPPTTKVNYFAFRKCAGSIIIDVLAKANPLEVEKIKKSGRLGIPDFDILTKFARQVDDEVGYNRSMLYSNIAAGEIGDAETEPSRASCRLLDIPEKYK